MKNQKRILCLVRTGIWHHDTACIFIGKWRFYECGMVMIYTVICIHDPVTDRKRYRIERRMEMKSFGEFLQGKKRSYSIPSSKP